MLFLDVVINWILWRNYFSIFDSKMMYKVGKRVLKDSFK